MLEQPPIRQIFSDKGNDPIMKWARNMEEQHS
jgi:hypothetical protein